MEHLRDLRLLDERGNPLNARVEDALAHLTPRFRRRFPALEDDLVLTEVLEEAGRKIVNRERRLGPVEKLHGYAWVTLRSVATSWLRRPSSRLAQRTLNSVESEAAFSALPAKYGTADQIERAVLLREVQAHLSLEERRVFAWKKAGFSGPEIAHFRGISVGAVDATFSRAKHKIRALLRVQQYGQTRSEPMGDPDGGAVKQQPSMNETGTERRDDESTRKSGSPRLQVRR